jgi:hypothetical protein
MRKAKKTAVAPPVSFHLTPSISSIPGDHNAPEVTLDASQAPLELLLSSLHIMCSMKFQQGCVISLYFFQFYW